MPHDPEPPLPVTPSQALPDDDLALPSVTPDEGRTPDEVMARLTVTTRSDDAPVLADEIAKVRALKQRRMNVRFVGIPTARQFARYRQSIMQVPAARNADKSGGAPDWND